MARPSRNILIVALLAVAIGAAAVAWRTPREKPVLGLFTTLPIYWGETADLGAVLSDESGPHWVRRALERDYRLRPLDVLGAAGQEQGLAGMRDLVLAQPRALSPAENVALDAWVREGGRVLLFADPMLTAHSGFALGDRRRPQEVILLSPLLSHWGLDLQFDETQPEGERRVAALGTAVPVNLPGRFALRENAGGGDATCVLLGEGLVARCTIGRGKAVVIADAALLEDGGNAQTAREAALSALLNSAFGGA